MFSKIVFNPEMLNEVFWKIVGVNYTKRLKVRINNKG